MRLLLATFAAVLLTSGCAEDPVIDAAECINELSVEEQQQGWRSLFDGQSMAQWSSYREDDVNAGWAVENGCLTRVGWGGDLITREQFADFELKLEWRISEAGNSGIFIRGHFQCLIEFTYGDVVSFSLYILLYDIGHIDQQRSNGVEEPPEDQEHSGGCSRKSQIMLRGEVFRNYFPKE